MAFANEIRDFIGAFEAGTKIKDVYRRRQIDQQNADNKLKIAQARTDFEKSKFDKTYGQNQQRLDDANKRFTQAIDLRKSEAASREENAAATRKRLEAADAERAKINRYKQDPFAQMHDEQAGQSQPALPTSVTPPASTPAPTQGVPAGAPAEAPGEQEGGAEDTGEAQPEAGIPTGGASPTAAEAGGRRGVAAALHGGLSYLQDHFGLNAGLPGQGTATKDGARRLFEGEGSNTPQEMKAINDTLDAAAKKNGVDPSKLTESERQIRNLTELYNWHVGRGDIKEANAAAAGIIQYSRGVASMLGAQALQKLQGGDVQGAAQDIITAHDQIPDGRHVELDPKSMAFKVIDEKSGDTLQEGQVTPDMIFSVANGFKDGSGFFKVIMDAASREPGMQNKPVVAGKAVKPEALTARKDYTAPDAAENAPTVPGAVQSELSNMKMSDGTPVFPDAKAVNDAVGPQALSAISNLGEMITKYNEVPADKAGRLALMLVNPADPGSKSKFDFLLINQNPNIMEIQASDGTRLKLPSRVATPLILEGHQAMTAVAQKVMQRQQAESGRRVEGMAREAQTTIANQANERRAAQQPRGIDVGRETVGLKDVGSALQAAGSGITSGLRSLVGVPEKRTAEEARKLLKPKKKQVAGSR